MIKQDNIQTNFPKEKILQWVTCSVILFLDFLMQRNLGKKMLTLYKILHQKANENFKHFLIIIISGFLDAISSLDWGYESK